MANIRRRPSGSWQATVFVGTVDGKKHYEYITRATKQECKAAATELEAEIGQGRYKVSSNITLGEAMDKYNKSVENIISPSTLRSYRMYARSSFALLRDRPIKMLKSSDLQSHYSITRSNRSSKTIFNEHAYIRVVLKKYLGKKNPCEDVILPKKVKYLYRTLSNEQIGKLINKIKGSIIEIPVLLALWCGLRQSEITGLRWQDVDFENKCLYIRQARVRGSETYEIKTPKSYSGTRNVHLPDYILSKIKKLKPIPNCELLFNENGNQMYQYFKRLLTINELPQIRFHDLRHLCATTMMSIGVPDLYASITLGHSDISMTKKYQHIRFEEETRSQVAIDNFFLSTFLH